MHSLIKKNQFKLDKTIWTSNKDGDKILVNKSQTDSDEGRFVASSIFEYKEKKFFCGYNHRLFPSTIKLKNLIIKKNMLH